MRSEDRYDSLFQFYGWKSGVDWLLLKAQVKQESNFDPDAKSRAGAAGLSQFMARTWEEWRDGTAGIQEEPPLPPRAQRREIPLHPPLTKGERGGFFTAETQKTQSSEDLVDPRDPEDAIRAQAAMMAWLGKQFGGDLHLVLAAYNWGIGNLKRLLQSVEFSVWKANVPLETQNYMARIETYYSQYRKEKGLDEF